MKNMKTKNTMKKSTQRTPVSLNEIEFAGRLRNILRSATAVRCELRKLQRLDFTHGWPGSPGRFSPMRMLADLRALEPRPEPGGPAEMAQRSLIAFSRGLQSPRTSHRKLLRLAFRVQAYSLLWLLTAEPKMTEARRSLRFLFAQAELEVDFASTNAPPGAPAASIESERITVPPPVAIYGWGPASGLVN